MFFFYKQKTADEMRISDGSSDVCSSDLWKEFDLEGRHPTWRVPPVRLKLKKAVKDDPKTPPHLVPLSRQAIAILKELKPLTGKQRYLFPSIRNRRQPMSENTINASLRRLRYAKATLTGHGFRHMAPTLLNAMGFPGDETQQIRRAY